MAPKEEFLSLENLGRGAAVELFDRELQTCLDNINDPNTNPLAIREVTLKVKIKPAKDRSEAELLISCTPRLAPTNPHPSRIYFGQQAGKNVALEHNPNQADLFEPPPRGENVKDLQPKESQA